MSTSSLSSGKGSLSAVDYRTRRGSLSAYGRAVRSARHLFLILAGAAALMGVACLAIFFLATTRSFKTALFMALIWLLGVATLLLIWSYTRTHFIEPDLAFRKWLQQVCDGDLDASIDLPKDHQHHRELAFHTGNLATSLMRLSNDMESLVENQTTRLNQQKQVLELLFALTADVAGKTDERSVYTTVCQYLADWFGGAVASVYVLKNEELLLTAKGVSSTVTLTRSAGEVPDSVDRVDYRSISEVPVKLSLGELVSIVTIDEPGSERVWHRVRLPFFSGEQVAGMLVIRAADNSLAGRIETERVLATVSEQLSLFVSKQTAFDQTHDHLMARDRNHLAAEIHDSLAQTLLATRYQITMLRESMEKAAEVSGQRSGAPPWIDDVVKLEATVSEANQEVRGLIQEYRNPLSEHRHAGSIESAIQQFRESTALPVFFQSDDPNIRFSPREDANLRRIVIESLNNAAKYAQASMIRVYLRCDQLGVRSVLIEDDGKGFTVNPEEKSQKYPTSALVGALGEHVGLSIMRERALSIGANLHIESEPGEGTRVSVDLPPLIVNRRQSG